MPNLDHLTENDFKHLFNKNQWDRAWGYLSRLTHLKRIGNSLEARVVGTSVYQVELQVEAGGIHTVCTCPYGGNCKHIAAVLIQWVSKRSAFVEESAVSAPSHSALETTPVPPQKTYRPKQLPDWLLKSFSIRQKEAKQKFAAEMEHHRVTDLRNLSSRNQWKLKGNVKAAVIEQVIENFLDHNKLAQVVSLLTPEQQAILRAVALIGHYIGITEEHIEKVANLWQKVENIQKTKIQLVEAGLFSGALNNYHNIFINPSISPMIMASLQRIFTGVVSTVATPPPHNQEILANPTATIHTALQLVLLWEQASITLRAPLPRPKLEKFYSSLTEWDYQPDEILKLKQAAPAQDKTVSTLCVPPPQRALIETAVERYSASVGGQAKLDFFYHLLVQVGIFQPGSPVTVWSEVKNEFFLRSEAAQWNILARTYLELEEWNELWELLRETPELKLSRIRSYIDFKPNHLRRDLLQMRHIVLRVLACLPDNEWITYKALQEIMRQVWPTPVRTSIVRIYYHNSPPSWQITYRGFVVNGKSSSDWDILQDKLIQYMLINSLQWLGMVDVCLQNQQVVAFRLHGLADVYWDRVERATLPAKTAVSTRTNRKSAITIKGDLILMDATFVNAQVHTLLGKIATLRETSLQQFTYQLDIHTTYATFEAGGSYTQLLEEWQQHLTFPMPDNMQNTLNTWWQGYGKVRVYQNVTFIELGDEYALAELKAVTSLNKLLIAEISPQLILIPETAVATLTAELEKAGYTPKKE